MEKIKPSFSVNEITKTTILKQIKGLNPRKISQSNDIPTNLIKEFSDMFGTIFLYARHHFRKLQNFGGNTRLLKR